MTLQDFTDMLTVSIFVTLALGVIVAWANGAFEYDDCDKYRD